MRTLLALSSLIVVAACASSPNGSAQDLTGCYYFDQDETARALNLPWGVELAQDSLTDAPLMRRQENLRVAMTLIGPDQKEDFPFGYWQPLSGDSIRLGYPGMGGFTVDLEVVGDELHGIIGGAGDVGTVPQRSTDRVRLTRAACPE